jgi:hypothetical protein
LSRCKAPDAESELDGAEVTKIERLQLAAGNAHLGSRAVIAGAECGQRFLYSLAVAVILIAHHDESGVRVQIASQSPQQLFLEILLTFEDYEPGVNLTPFGNQIREQMF